MVILIKKQIQLNIHRTHFPKQKKTIFLVIPDTTSNITTIGKCCYGMINKWIVKLYSATSCTYRRKLYALKIVIIKIENIAHQYWRCLKKPWASLRQININNCGITFGTNNISWQNGVLNSVTVPWSIFFQGSYQRGEHNSQSTYFVTEYRSRFWGNSRRNEGDVPLRGSGSGFK